eukprot:1002409-Heterocapsa_arctica.AAC.1
MCVTFLGSQSYRGEPPLSPADAQRHVEPNKYNGSLKSVRGSQQQRKRGYRGIGPLSPLDASQNADHVAQNGVNGSLNGVNGSLNGVNV